MKLAELKERAKNSSNNFLVMLSKRVTEERKKRKLSVRKLGELSGISYTVLYDLEERRKLPKIETILKLMFFFGIFEEDVPYREYFALNISREGQFSIIKESLYHLDLSNNDIETIMRYIRFMETDKEVQNE